MILQAALDFSFYVSASLGTEEGIYYFPALSGCPVDSVFIESFELVVVVDVVVVV